MPSEDSDQPARMRRLIRVLARCTCNIVGNVSRLINLTRVLCSRKRTPETCLAACMYARARVRL